MKPTNNEIRERGLVLKNLEFKPLINIKTNNDFSYSYALMARNNSVNSAGNLRWKNEAEYPAIAKKLTALREKHEALEELHSEMKLAVKDEDRRAQRGIVKDIKAMHIEIGFIIHPEAEREYVESRQAKHIRLKQQNELKLDAGTIAALTGKAPTDGVAEAKLKLANEKIAELEAEKADNPYQPVDRGGNPLETSPAEISTDEAVEDSADANNPWD